MDKQTIEVSAAMIKKDGFILAAQKGYGEFKGKWEFPGGKIQDGELAPDTLIREIKEELNANITVDEYLTTVDYEYPNFNLRMHTYLCTLVSDYKYVFHNEFELEHDNFVWLDDEDIDNLDWLPADRIVIDEYKRQRKSR